MTSFYVRPGGPRPDVRLVLAFLWGKADTNTDGNSRPATSRDWIELYAQNRERPDEVFDINPVSFDPLVLEVESQQKWLAAAVTHLLAAFTNGGASKHPSGPFESADTVLPHVGSFNMTEGWQRFRACQEAQERSAVANLEEIGGEYHSALRELSLTARLAIALHCLERYCEKLELHHVEIPGRPLGISAG